MTKSESNEFIDKLFGGAGIDLKPRFCNKCRSGLEKISVKTMDSFSTIMFCKNKHCSHYGLLTKVGIS